jgi:hypothetical protein
MQGDTYKRIGILVELLSFGFLQIHAGFVDAAEG